MTDKEHEKAFIDVLDGILKEVGRQVTKWGNREHTYREWKAILMEELAEMEMEVVVCKRDGYKEGVQVAAVMLSWLRNLKAWEIYDKKMRKIAGLDKEGK